MNTWKRTILSLLTITAAATLTAAGLCAPKTPLSAQANTAQASTAQTQTPLPSQTRTMQANTTQIKTPQGEKLVTPSTYEEYLSLTAPADVAATDGYIAIADGKNLFVFDKDHATWQKYVHENTIAKLHFGSRDQLYFLDGQAHRLYTLNAKTFETPTPTEIVCTTFSIHADSVYYINISSIYHAPLSDLSNKTELYAGKMYSPALSYWNGELYYVYGADYLHKLNLDTKTSSKVAELPSGVISMTISEGIVCCTTEEGGFYAYNLAELSEQKYVSVCQPIANHANGYAAVAANGNDVYLVGQRQIEKFSLLDNAFTEYCIGAASSNVNRFDGASELTLAGNKLFISDDNNNRISMYDTSANTFTTFPCELNSPLLASDGDSLLVSTASQAILYSVQGEPLFQLTSDKISGNVVGAAAVYGNYYLVTDTNYCYSICATSAGYTFTETLRKTHFAESLTADANGALYLVSNGAVYRYTEENFLSETEQGVKLCENIPADTSKIAVDYAGNLYALANNVLYCYAPQEEGLYALHSSTAFDKTLVYGATSQVLSFAFGIEDNAAYILYQDNYLTVSDELNLPTVKTIATEQVSSGIFGDNTAEFAVVQTLPNSLIVEVDGKKLQDAETFSYLNYYRATQPITALKIGETANYALLSYRENKASAYKTILVAKSRQAELDSEYAVVYKTQTTGYLTNLSKAYKFPSMDLPALGELEKNAQATILGEINGLDCEYYAIAYDGQTAYIPKTHVLSFNGAPPITETITIGNGESNQRAIWRLAYLVLGSAAICILVDTLILRKKDDD